MTATATKSEYYITIPIQASYSVCLSDLPSGLSDKEVLALLTPDLFFENGELSYPLKHKEEVWAAIHTVENKSAEVDITEEPSDA